MKGVAVYHVDRTHEPVLEQIVDELTLTAETHFEREVLRELALAMVPEALVIPTKVAPL